MDDSELFISLSLFFFALFFLPHAHLSLNTNSLIAPGLSSLSSSSCPPSTSPPLSLCPFLTREALFPVFDSTGKKLVLPATAPTALISCCHIRSTGRLVLSSPPLSTYYLLLLPFRALRSDKVIDLQLYRSSTTPSLLPRLPPSAIAPAFWP
ncbi:hypothetical protein BDV10DRAFT_4430 [Aspergillus recurvatus]